MPKIIGEPIPDYVAHQINKRQSVHGKTHDRTAEDIAYLNSKTAWVKLASGVALSDERITKEKFRGGVGALSYDTLAKRYVLFGGTARKEGTSLIQRGTDMANDQNAIYDTYTGVYNVNADENPSKYGLAPMPGIISADIQCLNRGSIKKATVKIKCYTPEQFHILDILYMRIGYTMLLEWGSSFYHNDEKNRWENMGYTLTEAADGFFAQTDYYAMLPRIEGYRKAKSGNYDGLISKVVNFNWSFAQDGSYDITLELISVGDVIESLKCNVIPPYEMIQFINQSYTEYTGETNNDEEKDTQQDNPANNIISSYLFLQKLYLKEMGVDEDASRDVTLKYSEGQINLGATKIKPPKDGIQINETIYTPEFRTSAEARVYVNQNYSGLTEISGLAPSVHNNEFDITEQHIPGGSSMYVGRIWKISNSQDIEITSNYPHTNVVYFNYNNGEQEQSSDLGFYMRLGHLLDFIQDRVIPHNTKSSQPLIKIDNNTGLNKMYTMPYQVSLDPRVCIVNGREKVNTKEFYPELDAWKMDGEDYTARIMNIYVNHNHINQLVSSHLDEKGNFNLFSFLQTLCTDINKALGGINTLEPTINEDEQVITIIDQSYSPTKQAGDKYGLELYGYNPKFKSSNFVRNISLKTEITPEFATMATIGSTAGGYVKGTENTMFSKWNEGIIDRYKKEFTSGTQTPEQMKEDVRKTYLEDFWKQRSSAFGLKVSDGNVTLDDNIIEKNITNVTEFYKLVYAKMQKENPQYSSPSNGFIPISLGVTMDGISGFKIYNSLNVSTKFLPANYGENLHFIVKSVNHKLSNNDWETTLETVVIAKNDTNG
jgi:hypothetical protein